jgi:hypothetical protein
MDHLVKGRDSEAWLVLCLQFLGSPVTNRVMLLQGSMTGKVGAARHTPGWGTWESWCAWGKAQPGQRNQEFDRAVDGWEPLRVGRRHADHLLEEGAALRCNSLLILRFRRAGPAQRGRRISELAAHLVDRELPHVPVRQRLSSSCLCSFASCSPSTLASLGPDRRAWFVASPGPLARVLGSWALGSVDVTPRISEHHYSARSIPSSATILPCPSCPCSSGRR